MIRVRGIGAGHQYDETLRPLDEGVGQFTWKAEVPDLRKASPVASDLLRIGRAVHLADRLVRRGQSIRSNLRRLDVEVSVADPVRWRKVGRLLEELAEFACGGDSWSLSFVRGATDEILHSGSGDGLNEAPTIVALFSGGLDSLCGAAYLAAQKHSRPLFVTHSPPGRESAHKLVGDTFLAFGREFSPSKTGSYRLEVREATESGVRSMFQEPTRRTRPFYYLTLACATAIVGEASAIQMSENGALALSPMPHSF